MNHASHLRSRACAGLLLTVLAVDSSQAAVVVDEHWAGYTDNTLLNTVAVQPGRGLTGTWTGSGVAQNGVSDTISYTYGNSTVTGNFAHSNAAFVGTTVSASLNASATGTLYFRFPFVIPGVNAANDTGFALNLGTNRMGWRVPTSPTFGTNTVNGTIFIGTTFGGGTTSNATFNGPTNSTLTANGFTNLLIGRLDYVSGNYTTASLWLNPSTNNFEDLSSLTTKVEGAGLAGTIASFSTLSLYFDNLNAGGAGSTPRVGRLTIGTEWADIGMVPEPSAGLLMALAGLGVALRRRCASAR